ncbi:atp synthase subunit a : ATP synthase subunit a OS=Singulisphaera acidiphila (strain ATCC BAA-1392 / DSM 18658 / VKM B-2454 / MOB10) GN=atpB PE=3 SV=1: ATP-synt_A [Gemmataceae bacterium]|nr:atp synthase subunit a : ATP synthase subunit a OS=Singulisphaera acidiphila (strain ATCC BAA-1392 / DSM 18658 / VKM B-2454 / MOB10) GN=atpB PE=3 SV=1: ATP-synt_A [Gemmataceae bacterium]VTT97667.1 atp synthase subunit a : ATP synthase subunit a OS=Singulisphaera acidiphila (strain ATCC BAA-1392 / DSM 18658 / VKM B-2454 / MOB10) GN=atpB PE=3 SV=1: ATP-synt_A [Gemmataceae bacterium]
MPRLRPTLVLLAALAAVVAAGAANAAAPAHAESAPAPHAKHDDHAGEKHEKAKIDPFAHVVDSNHIEILPTAGLTIDEVEYEGFPLKFIILITVSALVVAAAMIYLSEMMRDGDPPTGKLWNLLESLLFFIRDKIVRPGVGEHDANAYLPYLATLFLFIFAMNLIGMVPFLGSPTAAIPVTAALAFVSFLVIHVSGVASNGFGGYLKTFIPHIELEGGLPMKLMGFAITFGMAILEYATAFIRVGVLAVRLFANMLAGHTVLFMILFFIALVSDPAYQVPFAKENPWIFWGVMPFSVALVTALSLLELFIAGLQAFIFTFLTAVFIGLAKHPPH